MEAGLTTEVPLCTYDFDTHILTTPRDEEQEGVLSDVRSLPFFQDALAEKLAADASKKTKKAYTAPEMCFQLGSRGCTGDFSKKKYFQTIFFLTANL
jgi:hypothetical protein